MQGADIMSEEESQNAAFTDHSRGSKVMLHGSHRSASGRIRSSSIRRRRRVVQPLWAVLLCLCMGLTSNQDGRGSLLAAAIPTPIPIVSKEAEETIQQQPPSGPAESIRKRKKTSEEQDTDDDRPNSMNKILIKAGKRGLGGGIPGAIAGVVQVLTLMWLRTVINYQSRYGANFIEAFRTLMKDGGIARFYRGLSFALVQAPLARFVSTAANDSVEYLLASMEATKDWGPGRSTIVAGFVVGIWRILLMPIDTCKTVLQVDSVEGFRSLMRRVKAGKVGVLYQGAAAQALSAFLGHYPWFTTYNFVSKSVALKNWISSQLVRNALTGLMASIVADTTINSLRVVKTTKQAMATKHEVGYGETIRMIVAADGWKGLFGRGLKTRVYANALQSIVFTVIWRGLAERWEKSDNNSNNNNNSSGEKVKAA